MNTHTHSTPVPSADAVDTATLGPPTYAERGTYSDLEAVMIEAHRDYQTAVRSFEATRTDGARARMIRANKAWFTATNHYQK